MVSVPEEQADDQPQAFQFLAGIGGGRTHGCGARGRLPGSAGHITMQAPAGGGPDVIARLVADGLSRRWRQQVVIVNRPGGGGVIALQAALTAPPDGYALFMGLSSTFVVLPETHPELGSRLRSDLKPVGLIGEQPMVIGVNARLGISTLKELVSPAKNHPGTLLYGSAKGSLPNLDAIFSVTH